MKHGLEEAGPHPANVGRFKLIWRVAAVNLAATRLSLDRIARLKGKELENRETEVCNLLPESDSSRLHFGKI